jgi:hypothetical protein
MATFNNSDLKEHSGLAIEAASKILAPVGAFAKRVVTDQTHKVGQQIMVDVVSAADPANTFDESTNNYGTDNGAVSTAKPVTLSKPIKSTFSIGFDEMGYAMRRMGTEPSILDQFFKTHTESVAIAAMNKIQAQIQLLNFGTGIDAGASSAFDVDKMIDVRKDFRSASGANRFWAVLNDDYYAALLKDLKVPGDVGFRDSLINGVVPGIVGFEQIIETNILTANSESRVGFVTDQTGLVVANYLMAPTDEALVNFEMAVDPLTGLVMGYSYFMDKETERVFFTVRTSLDVGIGRVEGLKLLVSAATTVATPTFTPGAGAYSVPVAIATATAGATIYYTINGDTPTTASTLYTGPVTLAASATIKAIAVKNGYTNSAVGSAAYTI